MAFGIASDVSRLHGRRCLVAQHLLDRTRDQREIIRQLPTLIRVIRQQLTGEADQTRRRLVARTCDHAGVHEHLGAGQPPKGAVLLHLRVEQLGHQIVGGMVGPPVDIVGEHLVTVYEQVLANSTELAILQRDGLVRVVANRRLVLFWNPQQVADCPHRDHRADVADEVEPVRADQRVERTHQNSRVRGSIASIRRGVKTLESKRR